MIALLAANPAFAGRRQPDAPAPLLGLQLGPDGDFNITHGGKLWLRGGEVRVGLFCRSCSADLALKLQASPVKTTGNDALGDYEATSYTWTVPTPVPVSVETVFRYYAAVNGTIVFEQHFPHGVPSFSPKLQSSAATLFPAFARNDGGPADELACAAYHGVFPQIKKCTVPTYSESHQGGVPLVLYDPRDARLPMAVFSPLSTPKAQHLASDHHSFGAGVKATAAESSHGAPAVPAGWRQTWILSAAHGVNEGFQAWGDRLLAFSGKPRASLYRDATHSTIGYWTDNGGYYHYSTGNGSHSVNGSYVYEHTYEEVLPKVKASHDAAGVPFGHWQFDSWFYPKDAAVNGGGGGGGVMNWTADPAIFPSGMAAINRALDGMPMVMHNRQWSPESDYIHNLSYTWQTGPRWAVPDDPEAFFTWFFRQQQGWGLSMYEQDWMCTEYDGVGALQTNVSLADTWLAGMAAGAAAAGLTVQYCMPYAHDILSGAAHAAVTNARATGDYFHAEHQWAVGGTALFYWALGILPFKDGFYSSSLPQVGGQTVGPELNPDREILMATLSGAMVGPMDGLGLLNASRVMASCRKDGLLLKPDVPVTTADWCWRNADPECFVYLTHSDVRGFGRAHYLYADTPLPFNASLLPPGAEAHVWHDWYSGAIGVIGGGAGQPDQLRPGGGYEGHMYVVATPLTANGWSLLGEVGKYVPLSSTRFVRVVQAAAGTASPADGLTVELAGVAGEQVELCAAYCGGGACAIRRDAADGGRAGGGDGGGGGRAALGSGGGAPLAKVCVTQTFAASVMNVTLVRPAATAREAA